MFSKLVLLVAVAGMLAIQKVEAKGGGTAGTAVMDPAPDAKKAAKEAEKLAKKAAKAAEKAAKKGNRIELKAEMEAPELAPMDPAMDPAMEAPENEASLKYRSRGTQVRLSAEVEGFNDGDIFKMYVVINNAEVLVATLELVAVGGAQPSQEIEFDETTWPAGVPLVLTEGTPVKLRDAQGALIFESTLMPK